MYWWGNNSHPNAGDYYGKWLLNRLGFNVQFSNRPQLLVCGSILGNKDYIPLNTKKWGVGLHDYNQIPRVKDPKLIYSVRGLLTLKKLNIYSSNVIVGDPGLLLSRFYKPKTQKKYDICIVSHWKDYIYFSQNYGNRYYIINMGTNNIKKIINSINKCNFTFSSSLHGIIFSHSLGIPSIHLEYEVLYSKKNFKFKDYYSVFNICYTKEDLKKESFYSIIKKYKNNRYKYLPETKMIKQIQDNLLFIFPYQKMTNVICTYVNKDMNINDWCKYHLNLGFDNIYIFNNNDKRYKYIGDYLDNKIKSRVHILNINNKHKKSYFYMDFYNRFKNTFKWCFFFDVSDYIVLDKTNQITQLFEYFLSKNISVIIMQSSLHKYNKIIDKSFKKSKNKINKILKNKLKVIVKGGHIGKFSNFIQHFGANNKIVLKKHNQL